MLAAALIMSQNANLPELPREFRAAWVATVDNIDWPSKPGLSAKTQQSEMVKILDTIENLNMNAIVFQIRPSADALYKSKLEPWSYYLSGKQGQAPETGYDPLEFTIAEAHKRGIEVHVWFNPYRAWHGSAPKEWVKDHVVKTHPEYTYEYGPSLRWMDPGVKAVQDKSLAVMLDVVKRYDVDGIHIDDYFYPYPVREGGKAIPFPDERSYQAYRKRGGTLSKSDWRRKNVDDFIQKLYAGIKKQKKWVKFGISPFGIWRPGVPKGIAAGIDQYEDLSADCLRWWHEGWCDYMAPQLYWPIEQKPQSFPVLLEWWKSENKKNRHLWPGLYTGRLNEGWNTDQVVRQVNMTKDDEVNGSIHFSMKSLTNNWKGINEALLAGPYKEKAAVPASPWLDNRAPRKPIIKQSDGKVVVTTLERNVHQFAVMVSDGNRWRLSHFQPASERTVKVPTGASAVAVFAMDRAQNASQPSIISL